MLWLDKQLPFLNVNYSNIYVLFFKKPSKTKQSPLSIGPPLKLQSHTDNALHSDIHAQAKPKPVRFSDRTTLSSANTPFLFFQPCFNQIEEKKKKKSTGERSPTPSSWRFAFTCIEKKLLLGSTSELGQTGSQF